MKLVSIHHLTFPQIETYFDKSSIGHTFMNIGDFIETARAQSYLFLDELDDRGEMKLQVFKVHEVVAQ